MSTRNDARHVVTLPFLDEREKTSCHVITSDDIEELDITLPIEFSRKANAIARDLGKTKPIALFSTSKEHQTFVTSDDVWKIARYCIKKVVSVDAIRPMPTFTKLKCPACGASVANIEPRYLLPPCPSGCNIYPSKWIVERGEYIDVASTSVILDDPARGQQVMQCYLDGENLAINANYAKLQVAASGAGSTIIDAVPFIAWEGRDKLSFALWITRVSIKTGSMARPPSLLAFIVDKEPTTEKETVFSVFFSNIEFMRALLGFRNYHLQRAFPDLIIRQNDGMKKVIEFEYDSKSFEIHDHDPSIVDYIVCWMDNREKNDDIKIIEMQKLIGKKIDVL